MRNRIELAWQVGYTREGNLLPVEMIPSVVPGAVQLDYAKAKGYGAYTYGDNWKDYEWMEDVYWVYETELPACDEKAGNELYFVSKGIDYEFEIILNGEVIYEQEGMFAPFELKITEKLSYGGDLKIRIHPIPKIEGVPVSKKQAAQSVKPPVSYGWDWHPRLVPLGIWDDTYLEERTVSWIEDAEVRYNLSEDLERAAVELHYSLSEVLPYNLVWRFTDSLGEVVFQEETISEVREGILKAEIKNPNLWWPNGEGIPVLYNSSLQIFNADGILLDELSERVGFKRVRLVMHPGAWEYPKGHPCTRSNPPITMEINNRTIFCKGTNWVNPEIFPGIITKETYRSLLILAKDANMNMLRSWGGGIINKESFFELCDDMGLMVWQEFPLACNNYEGTPHYLKVLDKESTAIIKRIRRHACLSIWCGGNELFNSWSGMTDQSLALRLLNSNCFHLDPEIPFLMTSPLTGMAHGNYLFRYHDGREVFQVMSQANNTAYTEFGCPGPSSADYLRTFIPEEELFPPKAGGIWESHHGFNAWMGDTWLQPEVLKLYFGEASSLEELVEWGQLLQCEGYKCIYEEARRQAPKCSMALNWCYNEPWPTAANNSLINWPDPKPAYYAVKNSLRPVLASVRIPKFTFTEGELFTAELWILNDSPESVHGGTVMVYLIFENKKIQLMEWKYPPLAPKTNFLGPKVYQRLPECMGKRMTLLLETPEQKEYGSEYVLLYQAKK